MSSVPGPAENVALLHDWSRVAAGVYHDFHNAWILHLKESLNGGRLPEGYYALGEQKSGPFGPDLLTLQSREVADGDADGGDTPPPGRPAPAATVDAGFSNGSEALAVAEAPPRVAAAQETAIDAAYYARLQRTLMIRHVTDDRVVAVVEIMSPGNRNGNDKLNEIVDKAIALIKRRIHVVLLDPIGAGPGDPGGIHAYLWNRLNSETYTRPPDKPQTLVAYTADWKVKAWIEPMAVGDPLIPMPLFLDSEHYVPLPLSETYASAFRGMPPKWQRAVEPSP